MKQFNSYSAAMLKAFEQCPKKFEYKYIKGINIPVDSLKTQQGKNIHALASYYLKNFNTDKLEKTLSDNELKLWNNLKSNKYFNMDIIKSEYSIMAKADDYWINGRFDALVKEENNYYILDYKTGSIPQKPEEDYQTIIYLLIADKFIKNYTNLSFVYIDLKNNTDLEIKLDKNLKHKFESKIIKSLNEINKCIALSVFKTSNPKYHCEYSKFCREFC